MSNSNYQEIMNCNEEELAIILSCLNGGQDNCDECKFRDADCPYDYCCEEKTIKSALAWLNKTAENSIKRDEFYKPIIKQVEEQYEGFGKDRDNIKSIK